MRHNLRALLRSPGFTIPVVVTLALGIGANTAVFSVLRGVLLRPLPHHDGERLVYLRQSAEGAGLKNTLFSVPEILDYREAATALTGFAEISSMPFILRGDGVPREVRAGIVTGNYFSVMGLGPVLGRTLDGRDDGAGAEPAMVLGFEYWRNVFGADPEVLGRVLQINGRSVTIVGVVQPAPHFPDRAQVFVNMVTSPHHLDATMVHGRSHRMTEVFARLTPEASIRSAQTELDAIAARVHGDHPEDYEPAAGYRIRVISLRDALTADARRTLILLMAVAGLVLVSACANVGNLVLTRALSRERELTMRWALGAGKARLRGLLLQETSILAAAGAVLGILLAYGGLDLLVSFAYRFTPRATEIRMDGGVLLFTLLTATGAALAFAFTPSLRSVEDRGMTVLRTGARASDAGRRMQKGLIVAQVTAAVVVLAAAGLLTRTLVNLSSVDVGVDMENTLTMEVPSDLEGTTPDQALRLQEEIRDAVRSLPGVEAVGVGMNVPLRSSGIMLEVRAEGRSNVPGLPAPLAEYRTASPEYFQAAGMEILAGRNFANTDEPDGAQVAILNESLARRLFGESDPIGQRVAWTGDVLQFIGMDGRWRTVVGVVNDTRDGNPSEAPALAMYQPLAQNELGWYPGAFVIRAARAETLVPDAERMIREMAPTHPIERVATLGEIHQESISSQRLNAYLVGGFGFLALVIAGVGLAGVLAFFTAQRTIEIGVRMSLGAGRADVLRMVLIDGGILVISGLSVGLVSSMLVARMLRGMLFGVAPHDPGTMLGVVFLMLMVGGVACAAPARQAASVDPLVAIRDQ